MLTTIMEDHHHNYFYRPQTKLRKGNVFTSVCQEFRPQGEMYTPLWADTPGQTTTYIRRPLQQTVRILLECIIVKFVHVTR